MGENLSTVEELLSSPAALPPSSWRRVPAQVAHLLARATQKL